MIRVLITLLALCSMLRAEEWTGTSDVKFNGTSTLHDFEGTVRGIPLQVVVKRVKGSRVISASSDVEVKKMTTDQKERDENMWKMFKSPAFRFIKIAVPETPEAQLRPVGGKPGTMTAAMTLAGTTSNVTGRVDNLRESASAAAFDLSFPVSLKAFGLNPPSTLAGLIKVGDTVEVMVHVTLTLQKS